MGRPGITAATIRARLVSSIALALALALGTAISLALAQQAHADSGTVYACSVHPTYQHPVTGEIEDSGGASARATGQAMVDSAVSSSGMMEATDDGRYFLTIRMSLVDLTSGHTFYVQDWGETGWSTPAMGVTATGSDANGTTNDVCIQLPSVNGIVRVSMFVESMGRDVIFYVYADDLAQPAPSDFVATIVTEAASGDSAEIADQSTDQSTGQPADQLADQPASQPASQPAAQPAGQPATQDAAPQSAQAQSAAPSAQAKPDGTNGSAQTLSNAATASSQEGAQGNAAVTSADDLVEGAGAASAQGLSLSTAPAGEQVAGTAETSSVASDSGERLFALWLAVVSAGVVLMLAAAFIVYFCRRNWNRWAGYDPDDYSKEYRRG